MNGKLKSKKKKNEIRIILTISEQHFRLECASAEGIAFPTNQLELNLMLILIDVSLMCLEFLSLFFFLSQMQIQFQTSYYLCVLLC